MARLPKRRIKLYEVAEKAGVSQSAVSRYVNGNGYLSPTMRSRIGEAVNQLGYITDEAHPSRMPKRKMLGILLPNHYGLQYFSDLDNMFELFADKAGYHTMSLRPDFTKTNLVDTLQEACQERIAGLFVPSLPHTRLTPQEVEFVSQSVPPILFISEFDKPYPTMSCLVMENARAAKMAVTHLVEAGCRQLAFLAPPAAVNKSSAQRAAGFMAAVHELGLDPKQQVVVEIPFSAPMSPQMGYDAAVQALAQNPNLDGFLCWNDIFASGALWILAQTRRNVPTDVKVITFNDEYSKLLCPPVSTVYFSIEQIAQLAVEQLCRLQDPVESMLTRQIHLAPTLVTRASTQHDWLPDF